MNPSVLILTLLLSASQVQAQTVESVTFRVLQVNAIAAPTADAWTTLATNRYANLIEQNPLLRRADGSASPVRTVLLKSGFAAVNLTILHIARSKDLDEAKGVRWLSVGIVLLMNGLEYRAAVHNARLPHGARR